MLSPEMTALTFTACTADRIFVLNKYRIIESGTHQKLMTQKGFYFRLHQLQQ